MFFPSGDTSTDVQVPSEVSNEIFRASARGVLISAAGSFYSGSFFFAAESGATQSTRITNSAAADFFMRATPDDALS
jgi:hypothetical protein